MWAATSCDHTSTSVLVALVRSEQANCPGLCSQAATILASAFVDRWLGVVVGDSGLHYTDRCEPGRPDGAIFEHGGPNLGSCTVGETRGNCYP